MATDVLDFAALEDSAAATETVDTQETVETTDAEPTVETTETTDEGTNEDGSEKTPEQKAEAAKATKGKETVADGKTTPDSVSKVLKSIKDADPKNGGVVKALRDAYFGEQAFKREFPTVQAAREAKAFIEAVGGVEGWESTQNVLTSIQESDELVHNGDPKIWDNIVEDLKSGNHMDSLPKLAAGGLDTLKKHNENAYWETIAPHFLSGLEQVNLPKAIDSLDKYIKVTESALTKAEYKGDVSGLDALKTIQKDMKDWIKGLQDEKVAKEQATTKVDPERLKFEKERADFAKQQTEAGQTRAKEFRDSVALDCDKYSNRALGKELGAFLKLPFFKGFPRETLVDLGNGIKSRLYSALEGDKAYQIAMKAQWKEKSPNKEKISQIHTDKLNQIAKDIVTQTIENRYPGYARGGSASARVAAATVKKEATVKASDNSVASNRPIYTAVKPKNLVRENVTIGGKEYTPNDLTMLEIGGKGFVKSADNKQYRFVTWRKN